MSQGKPKNLFAEMMTGNIRIFGSRRAFTNEFSFDQIKILSLFVCVCLLTLNEARNRQ